MATLTTITGPTNIGPKLKMAVYQVALDSSYPTGGEAIDISGDFDFVYAVVPRGNDTLADNGYVFDALLPSPTTAVSSTNVLITAHWSADGTDGEVMKEFTNTGTLAAVGQLSVLVIGS